METFEPAARSPRIRERWQSATHGPRIEREKEKGMIGSATRGRRGKELGPRRRAYAAGAAALGLTLAIPVRQATAQD
jgi:hypothetical protein